MDKDFDIVDESCKDSKRLKSIELLGNELDISEISELDLIELFSDNSIEFGISYGDEPSLFKIRFVFAKNNKRAGFLEVYTDDFVFGFCCGKLCYIIIKCETDNDLRLISNNNDKENIYDKFNIFSMVNGLKTKKDKFIINMIVSYVNCVTLVGNVNGKWYVNLELEN